MVEFSILSKIVVFMINVIGFTLMLTVILGKVKKKLKVIFTFMIVLMFLWVNFAFFARVQTDEGMSVLFIRIAWAITPLLFTLIYYFLIDFFEINKKYTKLTKILFFLGGLFLFVTLFTDLIIQGIAYGNNELSIVYGQLVWFFFGIITVLTVINFYLLFKQLNVYKSAEDKNQVTKVKLLLTGLTIFFIMNAIFNISLPVFLRIVNTYEFGDYSTIIFMSFLAYATVKYNFFGVKVVFTNFIVTLLGAFLFFNAVFVAETPENKFLQIVIFVFYLPIAGLLIRSILNEIKQRELLQELSRQQKDIIDVMGHEIRTPLTAIVQELNIQEEIVFPKREDLIEGKLEREEREKLLKLVFDTLQTIDSASTHAVAIASDMLETARLDKGRFELNYKEFDLVHLAKTTIKVMKKTKSQENMQIDFESSSSKIMVKADEVRIREAIYAVINNAIKYKDPQKEKTLIHVSIAEEGADICIHVKDNGIGIKREDIKRLGKKFMRLDAYTSKNIKRPGGTGLGLYVVKGIMKHHKGDLIISSPGIGQGSTFTLKFPNLLQ